MLSCENILKYRNENNAFAKDVGIITKEIRPGYARGEISIEEKHGNVVGSLHGGVMFSLADTIGGAAAASRGMKMTTISSDFHFLSPGMGTEKLYAEAKEIKYGKKICVYDINVYDEEGKVLAKGTFSYFNLEMLLM